MNSTEKLGDGLLKVHEVAERVGVTKRTIHAWVARGVLPRVKIGPARLRFRPEDVDALIRRETVSPESKAE